MDERRQAETFAFLSCSPFLRFKQLIQLSFELAWHWRLAGHNV
jgi:hypothetical protein